MAISTDDNSSLDGIFVTIGHNTGHNATGVGLDGHDFCLGTQLDCREGLRSTVERLTQGNSPHSISSTASKIAMGEEAIFVHPTDATKWSAFT
jgi:hypothetical protein